MIQTKSRSVFWFIFTLAILLSSSSPLASVAHADDLTTIVKSSAARGTPVVTQGTPATCQGNSLTVAPFNTDTSNGGIHPPPVATSGRNEAGTSVFFASMRGPVDWSGPGRGITGNALFTRGTSGIITCLLLDNQPAVNAQGTPWNNPDLFSSYEQNMYYPGLRATPIVDSRNRVFFKAEYHFSNLTSVGDGFYHITENGSVRSIARMADPVPGGGFVYTSVASLNTNQPILEVARDGTQHGRTAILSTKFSQTLIPAGSGGYPNPNGLLSVIYDVRDSLSHMILKEGTPYAFGTGTILAPKAAIGNTGSAVLYGKVSPSTKPFVSLLPAESDQAQALLVPDQTLPGQPAGTTIVDSFNQENSPALNNAGDVVISPVLRSGSTDTAGVWLWKQQTGEWQKIMAPGDAAPQESAGVTFESTFTPANARSFYIVENGRPKIYFWATIRGTGISTNNNVGLWVSDEDGAGVRTLRKVFRAGESVVGLASGEVVSPTNIGKWMALSPSGNIAFLAHLTGSPANTDDVMLIYRGGVMKVAAREGDIIPGTNNFISGFGQYVEDMPQIQINNLGQIVTTRIVLANASTFVGSSLIRIDELGIPGVILEISRTLNLADGDHFTPNTFLMSENSLSQTGTLEFHAIGNDANTNAADYRLMRNRIVAVALSEQCRDGIDNDNDGAADYPADFSCTNAQDTNESSPTSQCQDGIDNDNDSTSDYPADQGCASKQDNIELAQCQDGIDNDNDGFTDWPVDQGCSIPNTDTEQSACQDGIDNDGDGAIDVGDMGCFNASGTFFNSNGTNEGARRAQCQDGVDNDGDGRTDFPTDTGCAGLMDSTEANATPPDSYGQIVCEDSDNGLSYGTRGHVTQSAYQTSDPSTTIADYCVLVNIQTSGQISQTQVASCTGRFCGVAEQYCDAQAVGFLAFPSEASNICPNGCSNGACIGQAAPQCSDSIDNDGDGFTDAADSGCSGTADDNEVGSFSCRDSDNGNNQYTPGTIQLLEAGTQRYRATDTCTNSNTLREYRCSGASLTDNGQPTNAYTDVTCQYGCGTVGTKLAINDACKSAPTTTTIPVSTSTGVLQKSVTPLQITDVPGITTNGGGGSLAPFLNNLFGIWRNVWNSIF